MKAMILAAGRGERMLPLTATIAKALIQVGGKPLIAWHLERLAQAGIKDVVINLAHLGSQIETSIGNGSQYGLNICYSKEREALETAGGVAYALPLLGDDPFLLLNADIYCEIDFKTLVSVANRMHRRSSLAAAHLVLVDNPEHNKNGDFALQGETVKLVGKLLTYSGVGVYRPEMFRGIQSGAKENLAPLLRVHIAANRISGEHYSGCWIDVGTPERLYALEQKLSARPTH
jgi:N-acetyl-alpha-D-muramate 1-phosphate uridylyltransferase